jgi:hypothetical protein
MLKTKDMFTLSEAVDKMGLTNDLPNLFKGRDKKNEEVFGVELLTLVASKLYKARKEVVELIVSDSGKTKEEVEGMGMKEFVDTVKAMLSQEDVKGFFTSLAKE